MAKQKTHEEFMSEFEQLGNKNVIVLGRYVNSTTKILVKCKIDGHEWSALPNNLLRGHGCPVCVGLVAICGINDLATTHPGLVKYFINSEDATRVTHSSKKRLEFKCPDCGALKIMPIYVLSKYGFACPMCGQTISYPNRVIRSVMNQLHVDFLRYEWSAKWTNKQKYDVYFEIDSLKYVIEMQGEQHYGAGWNKHIPIDELIEYDNKKANRAKRHGINPILIDARLSDFDFIFSNIMNSVLSEIFDLSIIDLGKCRQDSEKNIVKQICMEYDSNPDVVLKNLAEKYNIHRSTVSKYLKKGNDLGWCVYCANDSIEKRIGRDSISVKVFLINHTLIGEYPSVSQCVRELNQSYNIKLNNTNIARAAKSGKPYHNLYFEYA